MDPQQTTIVIGRKAKYPKQPEGGGGGGNSRPDVELTGSKAVSRRHAVISRGRQGGEWFTLNCEGKNNVYHNRQLLTARDEPALLRGGDVVSIGGIMLEVGFVMAPSVSVSEEPARNRRHDE